MSYSTPGVYVEEKSTFPPSIAEVSTAVPAFLGYTAGGPALTPTRVATMREFESQFGGAPAWVTKVKLNSDSSLTVTAADKPPLLYYSLRLYFDNGGGPCYIVSLGNQATAAAALADFKNGLAALEREDEPTLIVMPDATRLKAADLGQACGAALDHCGKMKDRFAILDVQEPQTATAFRSSVSSDYLSYGAAYTPYVRSALAPAYDEAVVALEGVPAPAGSPDGTAAPDRLDKLKATQTALYNRIKAALADERITLPPSGAMAGIYARVDRDRGVWKAPANVAVASAIELTQTFTDEEQGGLNIDPVSGKSINALRSFVGRGTLVWGARTLAGNDNEWRYVPVRRLFIMIEESAQQSTAFAVFEPNDATTWLKVKAMIESYLYGLWERGALAGSKPEAAYFVNVGLGTTMTPQDILEGRMNVEIGIAAVRPAEFIILRFSHKLQEA